ERVAAQPGRMAVMGGGGDAGLMRTAYRQDRRQQRRAMRADLDDRRMKKTRKHGGSSPNKEHRENIDNWACAGPFQSPSWPPRQRHKRAIRVEWPDQVHRPILLARIVGRNRLPAGALWPDCLAAAQSGPCRHAALVPRGATAAQIVSRRRLPRAMERRRHDGDTEPLTDRGGKGTGGRIISIAAPMIVLGAVALVGIRAGSAAEPPKAEAAVAPPRAAATAAPSGVSPAAVQDLSKPAFDTTTPRYDVSGQQGRGRRSMVAEVDGHAITLADLGDAIRALPPAIAALPFQSLYPSVLEELIRRQALV